MKIEGEVGNVYYDLDYDDMVNWQNNSYEEDGYLSKKNMTGILYSDIMDESVFYDKEITEEWGDTLSYLHDTLDFSRFN